MGQGQEYHARKMMTESMAGGIISQLLSAYFIHNYFSIRRRMGAAAECSPLIEFLR